MLLAQSPSYWGYFSHLVRNVFKWLHFTIDPYHYSFVSHQAFLLNSQNFSLPAPLFFWGISAYIIFPSSSDTMLLFRSNSRARPQLLSLLLVFAAFFQFFVLAVPLPIAQLEKRVGIPDSFDPIKIYQWLQRHKPADPSKLVFYTDKEIGKPMAEAFVHHNPGYAYFYDIYGPAFARDMGLVNGKYPTANAIPMSKAMGLWATGDTRVFNSPKGTS